MNLPKAIRQGQQQRLKQRLRQRSPLAQQAVQRLAVFVLHHDVGGVVVLEAILHLHQVWMLKTRQGLRFIHKPFEPPIETVLISRGFRVHA